MPGPIDNRLLVRRLQQEGLRSPQIVWFPEVESTQNEAARLARQGAPAGTLVGADRQTAGRGRQGRFWHSPVGGLHVSLVLRPRAPVDRWPALTVVAGAAAARALRRCGVAGVQVKWPNDLLLGGRKLAGMLAESFSEEGFCVLGLGLNLDLGGNWPPDLAETAIDLADGEPGTDLEEAAVQVLLEVVSDLVDASLEPRVDPEEVGALLWRDREVRVGDLQGWPEGVESGGELRLRDRHGQVHRVRCGEVTGADRH